ncbi:hypothetical protein PR048_016349 [Dryococelus australis]|uniref:Uncharacterized protein n=1 Tax=Dryococelus australis TaxID=614101 RepID=A0ABQ9HJH9_9NEOP|nr:hypothetical protein PR048_016349 [Dryococelus australis]
MGARLVLQHVTGGFFLVPIRIHPNKVTAATTPVDRTILLQDQIFQATSAPIITLICSGMSSMSTSQGYTVACSHSMTSLSDWAVYQITLQLTDFDSTKSSELHNIVSKKQLPAEQHETQLTAGLCSPVASVSFGRSGGDCRLRQKRSTFHVAGTVTRIFLCFLPNSWLLLKRGKGGCDDNQFQGSIIPGNGAAGVCLGEGRIEVVPPPTAGPCMELASSASWLDYLPPTKTYRVRFPTTGSLPDVNMWVSWLTMSLVGGVSRGFQSGTVTYSLHFTSLHPHWLPRTTQISPLCRPNKIS